MTRNPILTLDATGYRCPMPVVLMEKALRAMAPGEVLRVLADDPIAAVDIPHFAAAAGHRAEHAVADSSMPPGTCVFLVTAGGNRPETGAGARPETPPQGRHFLSEDGKG